jgi:hypothetical protein
LQISIMRSIVRARKVNILLRYPLPPLYFPRQD